MRAVNKCLYLSAAICTSVSRNLFLFRCSPLTLTHVVRLGPFETRPFANKREQKQFCDTSPSNRWPRWSESHVTANDLSCKHQWALLHSWQTHHRVYIQWLSWRWKAARSQKTGVVATGVCVRASKAVPLSVHLPSSLHSCYFLNQSKRSFNFGQLLKVKSGFFFPFFLGENWHNNNRAGGLSTSQQRGKKRKSKG